MVIISVFSPYERISSKGLQVAPQETEVESYVVGGIKQDVKKDTFSGFKL